MTDVLGPEFEHYDLADDTDFNWEVFEAILHFKATKDQCAMILGCSHDTIERRLKDRFGKNMTFTAYRKEVVDGGLIVLKLQQKAIQLAMKGNTMLLIYALNNLAGWQSNVKKPIEDKQINIIIDSDDAEL